MRERLIGILFCAVAGIIPWFLGEKMPVVGAPVFAIMLGMAIGNTIKRRKKLESGIGFTSKKILQYAVILLGFGLNIRDILQAGAKSLPIILGTISIALLVAFVFGRLLKVDKNVNILIGVGSSICGGSAIAAASPAINAEDEEIAQSISVIFLFNVLAALVFPTLCGYLGMSSNGFGIFAGTAINDTSSVTAAASSWDAMYSSNILEMATVVKLTRTLAIIPIVAVLSVRFASQREGKRGRAASLLPRFIVLFILASLTASIFSIPAAIVSFLKIMSKYFIVMAMFAIGFKLEIRNLTKWGIKPILLGGICWVAIAAASMLMQIALGIF